MLYRSFEFFLIITIVFACNLKKRDRITELPETASKIIHYLDSNTIREYDSVRFNAKRNANKYEWVFADKEHIAFIYAIGWGATRAEIPNPKDSVERFWISDSAYFLRMFPLYVTFPPFHVEIVKHRDSTISVTSSWDYEVINEDTVFYGNLKPADLFEGQNAFDYFRKRNGIMDSLGIYGINRWRGGNCLLITLHSRNEFLFYRRDRTDDDIMVTKELDSILATGKKIDAYWTYIYKPS